MRRRGAGARISLSSRSNTNDYALLSAEIPADWHRSSGTNSIPYPRSLSKLCYTAEQLVSAYLQRIEELDMSLGLNAIVLINPDAIKKAHALDKEYQQTGKLGQLHGIPMIVKDNYNTICRFKYTYF